MSFSCFRGNSFFSADRRRLEFQSGDRAIKNIMRTLIIFTARIVTTCAPVFPRCLLSGDRDRQNSYMLICCAGAHALRQAGSFVRISGMPFLTHRSSRNHSRFSHLSTIVTATCSRWPHSTASFRTVTLLHRAATGHLIEIHLNCLAAQKRTWDLFWNHKARRFYCANGCISRLCCSPHVYHSRQCSIQRILQIRNVIV